MPRVLRGHFVLGLTVSLLGIGSAHGSAVESTSDVSANSTAVPQYRVTEMRPSRAVTYGTPHSINNAGTMTGLGLTDETTYGGFIWRMRGPSERLPDTLTFKPIEADSINDGSVVAGYGVLNEEATGPRSRAFTWSGGQYSLLDALPSGSGYSYATDINNSGQIVGYSYYSDTQTQAVLWEGGTISPLGGLPTDGSLDSEAFALNEVGTVVGDSIGSNGQRAFIWRDGQMSELPVPAAAQSSSALDVNDRDEAVGYFYDGVGMIPALWSSSGMQQLPMLDTQHNSGVANSINESGDVVGLNSIGATGAGVAILWHAGRAYDLNKLIAKNLRSCVTLEEATSINESGAIAARGSNRCEGPGNTVTFRLEPVR